MAAPAVATGGYVGIRGLIGDVDAAKDGLRNAPPLGTTVPAGWTTASIIEGTGTMAIDPSWQDISDYYGSDELEAQSLELTGVDINVDGAWLIGGDLETGGVGLFAYSVLDTGGPTAPHIEALAFQQSSTRGIDGVEITAARTVTNASGLPVYILEYEFPQYDQTVTEAVGVVAEDERQLLVYVTGSETRGTGLEELEIVLDSATLD